MKTALWCLTFLLSLSSFAASGAKKSTATDVNTKNAHGYTSLMKAASEGDTVSINQLLSKKADPSILDSEGSTALMIAIYNEQTEAAKALVGAGTDLNVFNNMGESALIAATSTNNVEVIKAILAKDKTQINKANKNNETALMKAAAVGSLEVVRLLINAGANRKIKDHLGRTAYDIAKSSQNAESLKYLKVGN